MISNHVCKCRSGTACTLATDLHCVTKLIKLCVGSQPQPCVKACKPGACQKDYLHHVSMRRDEDGTPLTARRFLAIAQPGGDDDYFSAGFSEEERQVCAVRLVAIEITLL